MNISAKNLYKTASGCLMTMGAGHIVLYFVLKESNPAGTAVVAQMEGLRLSIKGLGNRSLLDFHEGFSITMGVLLFFTGLQNFLLAGNLKSVYDNHKGILLVPVLLTGIVFLLSMRYFFTVPQALSLIACLTYSMSFWKLSRESN